MNTMRPDKHSGLGGPVSFLNAVRRNLVSGVASTGMTAEQLCRALAFGRFLYRIFRYGGGNWVLKGGAALMARYPDVARPSVDLDLFWDGGISAALRSMESAVGTDPGDHFVFRMYKDFSNTSSWLQTLDVDSYIGSAKFISFEVDLVTDTAMSASPDVVLPEPSTLASDLPYYTISSIPDNRPDRRQGIGNDRRQPPKICSTYRQIP